MIHVKLVQTRSETLFEHPGVDLTFLLLILADWCSVPIHTTHIYSLSEVWANAAQVMYAVQQPESHFAHRGLSSLCLTLPRHVQQQIQQTAEPEP